MENLFNMFLASEVIVPANATEFTFWIGAMAMAAASVFFLLSLDAGGGKWRNSMLVSALITGIAAVHYLYMRDAYASMGGGEGVQNGGYGIQREGGETYR